MTDLTKAFCQGERGAVTTSVIPISLGHCKPGQISRTLPHLRSAEGCLHLAGEHLGPLLFRGLAQCAIESGLKATQEMLEPQS